MDTTEAQKIIREYCEQLSKQSAHSAGDLCLIPGLERSPGEGNGNPLQYTCLENSMDRRAWQATVHGVSKSQTGRSDCPQQTTEFS